jgi:hypothetical protein
MQRQQQQQRPTRSRGQQQQQQQPSQPQWRQQPRPRSGGAQRRGSGGGGGAEGAAMPYSPMSFLPPGRPPHVLFGAGIGSGGSAGRRSSGGYGQGRGGVPQPLMALREAVVGLQRSGLPPHLLFSDRDFTAGEGPSGRLVRGGAALVRRASCLDCFFPRRPAAHRCPCRWLLLPLLTRLRVAAPCILSLSPPASAAPHCSAHNSRGPIQAQLCLHDALARPRAMMSHPPPPRRLRLAVPSGRHGG